MTSHVLTVTCILRWDILVKNAVTNTGVAGYIYWEGVQWPNPTTNEEMIKVDQQWPYNIEVSKRLWAFANWSRFVSPGAVRLGISGGTGIKTAAFKNVYGSVAVVVISSTDSITAMKIKLGGITPTIATAWVTDSKNDCARSEASVAGCVVTGNVPARSITTSSIPPSTANA